MLRSASLKAKAIVGGARSSFGKPRVLVRFNSTEGPTSDVHPKHHVRSSAIPQPLPAVAYDYDWGEESNDTINVTASKRQDGVATAKGSHPNKPSGSTPDVDPIIVSLVAGRNPPSGTNKPYPPPSSMDRTVKPMQLRKSGGGGGGGGRHR